ncbi:hypothetical protein IEQ_05043 [Bacillus cereus BAG6X1-2]|nr:hypothetical protein IEQ_05043 [Bacillus cereus BAG6X1-2]
MGYAIMKNRLIFYIFMEGLTTMYKLNLMKKGYQYEFIKSNRAK